MSFLTALNFQGADFAMVLCQHRFLDWTLILQERFGASWFVSEISAHKPVQKPQSKAELEQVLEESLVKGAAILVQCLHRVLRAPLLKMSTCG